MAWSSQHRLWKATSLWICCLPLRDKNFKIMLWNGKWRCSILNCTACAKFRSPAIILHVTNHQLLVPFLQHTSLFINETWCVSHDSQKRMVENVDFSEGPATTISYRANWTRSKPLHSTIKLRLDLHWGSLMKPKRCFRCTWCLWAYDHRKQQQITLLSIFLGKMKSGDFAKSKSATELKRKTPDCLGRKWLDGFLIYVLIFQLHLHFRQLKVSELSPSKQEHSSRGWSRWPTGKNTTSQFMRVLLKRYQGPPRKGASSTKIWMLHDRVKTTYLPQNSWEFKGTMPKKALSRPYFLGKGVGIAGLPLQCSSTITENWITENWSPRLHWLHRRRPYLPADKKVNPPCFKVTYSTSLQDSTRRLHF